MKGDLKVKQRPRVPIGPPAQVSVVEVFFVSWTGKCPGRLGINRYLMGGNRFPLGAGTYKEMAEDIRYMRKQTAGPSRRRTIVTDPRWLTWTQVGALVAAVGIGIAWAVSR
jgi:hypothetical protein